MSVCGKNDFVVKWRKWARIVIKNTAENAAKKQLKVLLGWSWVWLSSSRKHSQEVVENTVEGGQKCGQEVVRNMVKWSKVRSRGGPKCGQEVDGSAVKRWTEVQSRGAQKCSQEVLRSVVGGGSEVQLRAGQKHSQ